MTTTRIPTQKRSLEKRKKIIDKGFELICEKGYYNTTTNDIAKYSGVSVGIIYQYFNDKKEIFLEGVNNYSASIMFPMLNVIENKKIDIKSIDSIINEMIDRFINSHKISKKAHEELLAMSHIDEEIGNLFKKNELEMSKTIVEIFKYNNIIINNIEEKIHIIMGIVDNLCHEVVYHKHENINYEIMKKEVVKTIINILS